MRLPPGERAVFSSARQQSNLAVEGLLAAGVVLQCVVVYCLFYASQFLIVLIVCFVFGCYQILSYMVCPLMLLGGV